MRKSDFGDSHAKPAMQAVQRAAEELGRKLLQVQFDETRSTQLPQLNYELPQLTDEQKIVVAKSPAFGQLGSLAAEAYKQKGILAVGQVLEAACEFYGANGMPYRQLESIRHSRSFGTNKGKPVHNEEALPSLRLWATPFLTPETGTRGKDSMLCADRQQLRDAAARYFMSGVRCIWFEKMLVQALIAAEAHATTLETRKNPSMSRGESGFLRQVIWQIIFDKSYGESPKYEFLHLAAALLLWVTTAAALGGLAYYSSSLIEDGKEIRGYIGMAAVLWVAVNWAGRFLTQRILSWASIPMTKTLGFAGNLHLQLNLARQVVLSPALSLKLAQETLLNASNSGVAFDQVAYGLVDRGIASGEVMWFNADHLEPSWLDLFSGIGEEDTDQQED